MTSEYLVLVRASMALALAIGGCVGSGEGGLLDGGRPGVDAEPWDGPGWCTSELCRADLEDPCGNGARGPLEVCDGSDLAGETCETLGFRGGELACVNGCSRFDTSCCWDDPCGSCTLEPDEVCDGAMFRGQTCESLGYGPGELACKASCEAIITTGCEPKLTLPIAHDFETDQGWSTTGRYSTWARGAPGGEFIRQAASGTRAWVTNLTGDYREGELSYLVSPCIDTGDVPSPTLTFEHIFETADFDSGWVEVSQDCGVTWQKLGTAGAGTNWYDDDLNHWWQGVSGEAGVWRTASLSSPDLASSLLRVRFVLSTVVTGEESRPDGFGVDALELR